MLIKCLFLSFFKAYHMYTHKKKTIFFKRSYLWNVLYILSLSIYRDSISWLEDYPYPTNYSHHLQRSTTPYHNIRMIVFLQTEKKRERRERGWWKSIQIPYYNLIGEISGKKKRGKQKEIPRVKYLGPKGKNKGRKERKNN